MFPPNSIIELVTIKALTPEGELSLELKNITKNGSLTGNCVHQLAARQKIQELVITTKTFLHTCDLLKIQGKFQVVKM